MRLKNMRGLVRSAIILLSLSATNVIFGSIIWQCPDAGTVMPLGCEEWGCSYTAPMTSNITSHAAVLLTGDTPPPSAKISAFHGRATWLTPGSYVSCEYSLNGSQEFILSISSNDAKAGQPANKDCKLIGGTLINPNTCYGHSCAVSCPDN